ncbi:endonuclease V [Natronorarus salvus]|uniref:endonuclease V n=1 Tax=Natronorarus salvus TaxID=3117733 RepID=UPI002F26243F
MRVRERRFVPDPSLSREEMEALQREIGKSAIFEDAPHLDPLASDLLVAGVDQAFDGDRAVSAVVLTRGGEVIERVHASRETEIPYIPGLLSFREGGSILAAFEELEREPDVVLVDGSGRIHYREAGLATHVGVTLDLPTVGVAKGLLCGWLSNPPESPFPAGTRVPVLADEEVSAPSGRVIGYALQTKQYDGNRHVNPVYVSPGHRVCAETATDLVEALCSGYKLPEPIRLADRYADEAKRR